MDKKDIILDLNPLIQFLDNDFVGKHDMQIIINDEKTYLLIDDIEIGAKDLKIDNMGVIKIFPIVKYNSYFKGISQFVTNEYVFLYLYEIGENIVVFSNNIVKYIEKSITQKGDILIGQKDFEKLTSSFFLFKRINNTFEWKNILSFFPNFLQIALSSEDYDNLLHKVKGDSIAFFKSRFIQEKHVTTIINTKDEGKNFFHAMFYANILKNLTFRIAGNYIDLNAKGRGGFNITTLKNNEAYFDKIKKSILELDMHNESDKTDFPVFFFNGNIGQDNKEEFKDFLFIDIFPISFKVDAQRNSYLLDFKGLKDVEEYLDTKDQ